MLSLTQAWDPQRVLRFAPYGQESDEDARLNGAGTTGRRAGRSARTSTEA